jgi:molecular chaperone HtpG
MRTALTKRVLGLLEKLASDKDKYAKFWKQFGPVLKEGPAEDHLNREAIAKLLRFVTTASNGKQDVSLSDYISHMPAGQEKIYYIAAETQAAAEHSPHLEIFRQKGIEVLLLTDRIDEWLVAHLTEFEGKPLQSVAKGDLDLGKLDNEVDAAKQKEQESELESFIKQAKEVLSEQVKDVRLTHRLVDSPACIVADEHDLGSHMQRILQAAGQAMPASKPILELNPKHPIIEKIKQETDEQRFAEWVQILFDQSVLAEGGQLSNPAGFVQRVNKFLIEMAA